ncbi:MAG: FAD-dependent oxidoreductase, partial [Rhodobacteraceae bacterium]|nr:FAD-dependent oxidoreductase [Paracoccaceae bacterium]
MSNSAPTAHESGGAPQFDVAVIGAGVVGCALARAFTLAGARVVVLEKAADVLDGASKANSAILHTGFDAPEGSLELACIREGYALYHDIRERLGLPLVRAGAMVLAWNEDEVAGLPALMAQAMANGVT